MTADQFTDFIRRHTAEMARPQLLALAKSLEVTEPTLRGWIAGRAPKLCTRVGVSTILLREMHINITYPRLSDVEIYGAVESALDDIKAEIYKTQ